MRVLLDIIHADGRIDVREKSFFNKLLDELALPYNTKDEISLHHQHSLNNKKLVYSPLFHRPNS